MQQLNVQVGEVPRAFFEGMVEQSVDHHVPQSVEEFAEDDFFDSPLKYASFQVKTEFCSERWRNVLNVFSHKRTFLSMWLRRLFERPA